MNKPDELNVPAVADHVTTVFRVWLTMAVNWRVFPEAMVAFEGDPEMRTPALPPEGELPPEDMLPPPQHESIKHATSKPKIVFRCGMNPIEQSRDVGGYRNLGTSILKGDSRSNPRPVRKAVAAEHP